VGLFPTKEHFPGSFCLPMPNQVNLAPGKGRELNAGVRMTFNIVECKGPALSGSSIADACLKLLSAPRYLRGDIARDIQLQQFVREWGSGDAAELSHYVDRNNSIDVLFREIKARIASPITILEAGSSPQPEDWAKSGYTTYLLGSFVESYGGCLISVDPSKEKCATASRATREMSSVRVVCDNPIPVIKRLDHNIDVLVLDGLGGEFSDPAEQTLLEVIVAVPKLNQNSIVVFDDTVWSHTGFQGRGTKAVSWLLDRGWYVLYSGYQTICVRRDNARD